MKVAVIGTGYVGLVAATCFADSGNTVITVDKIEAKIKKLLGGEIPIFEPGLEEMVKRNLAAKRLIPTTDMRYAIENSDVIFSAVGTPTGKDGKADRPRKSRKCSPRAPLSLSMWSRTLSS